MTLRIALFFPCFMWASLLANDPDLREDLERRRQSVATKMGGRGMLILFSGEPRRYTGDIDYEFRQENNLYYLTGIREKGIRLVLMPQNVSYREILFLPDQDPTKELWTGKMLSREEAADISGIKNVWSASEFESFLDSVLYGRAYRVNRYLESTEYEGFFEDLRREKATVSLLMQEKPGLDKALSREFEFATHLRERFLGIRIRDASPVFEELRMIKSAYELGQLRQAIAITVAAQRQAMERLQPGIWEYEVEAAIEHVFKKNNSLDPAFPSIVASGPNATVLHYQESQRQAQDGELMLIDIGAEYNYYAADITRTLPVSGKFRPEEAEIYQIVLDAQNAAMALVRPGSSLQVIHKRAVEVAREGLLRLGLITDGSGDQYRTFFPHGVGHWLGMDVHDVGPRFTTLQPGMVLTVEPGIYVREDALARLGEQGESPSTLEDIRPALRKYKNIGIRIEDDLLVTEEGYELLSAGAPREIAEIEAAMQRRASRPTDVVQDR